MIGPTDPYAGFRDSVVTTTVCVPASALIQHPEPPRPTYEAFIAVCFLIAAVAGICVMMHYFGNIAIARRWIKYRFAQQMEPSP